MVKSLENVKNLMLFVALYPFSLIINRNHLDEVVREHYDQDLVLPGQNNNYNWAIRKLLCIKTMSQNLLAIVGIICYINYVYIHYDGMKNILLPKV